MHGNWLFFTAFGILCLQKKNTGIINKVTITSFSPTEGASGSVVEILGSFFSTTSSIVKFGSETAEIISATPGKLTVKVPENAETGKISVTVDQHTATTTEDFKVNPTMPVIEKIVPEKGAPGDLIEIQGNHFKQGTKVFIGGMEAVGVSVQSGQRITFTVPANAINGKVRVLNGTAEAISPNTFYLQPVITGVNAWQAEQGATLEITGINFSEIIVEDTVSFGTTEAEVLEASPTLLKVRVPGGTTDPRIIQVKVKGMIGKTTETFRLLPTIDSYTPASGEPGTLITIQGNNLAAEAEISLGETPILDFVKKGRELISFKVPENAVGGKITIKQATVIKEVGAFKVTNIWAPVHTSAGTTVIDGLAFTHNNILYRALGRINTSQYFQNVEAFNLTNNNWSDLTKPAVPGRHGFMGTVANGKLYFGTGNKINWTTKENQADWWELDLATSALQAKTAYPFANDGGVCFTLNGKIYAGLGSANDNMYEFDPAGGNGSGTWKFLFKAGTWGREFPSVFIINNVAYIAGGYSGSFRESVFYKFDPASNPNGFTKLPDVTVNNLAKAIMKAPAFSLNGKGYIIDARSLYEYDPATGAWTTGRSVPNQYLFNYAVVVNGRAYAIADNGIVFEYIPR